MSKHLRPILLGLGAFFLGAGALYAFLRLSPESSQALLGSENPRHSSKPIVSALNLAPSRDEDEALPLPPPAPAMPPPSAGRHGGRGSAGPGPFPGFFDEDDASLFNGQDPAEAARKLHEQIRQQMQAGFAGMDEAAMGGGESITEKEDAQSLSYEIQGIEGSSLKTSVRDGYLTISGESKKQGAGVMFQSSFQRSFSLPRNVDASKMETISEKDKIILRFPKKG